MVWPPQSPDLNPIEAMCISCCSEKKFPRQALGELLIEISQLHIHIKNLPTIPSYYDKK